MITMLTQEKLLTRGCFFESWQSFQETFCHPLKALLPFPTVLDADFFISMQETYPANVTLYRTDTCRIELVKRYILPLLGTNFATRKQLAPFCLRWISVDDGMLVHSDFYDFVQNILRSNYFADVEPNETEQIMTALRQTPTALSAKDWRVELARVEQRFPNAEPLSGAINNGFQPEARCSSNFEHLVKLYQTCARTLVHVDFSSSFFDARFQ